MKMVKTKSFTLATYEKGDTKCEKLALVLPGRLDTKDYVHITSHVNLLGELGYLALSFDMPGTWDSPGDIADYTTTNYINVVDQLIDYFDNRPTLLLGHSRGGAVASLASRNQSVEVVVLAMANYGIPTPPETRNIRGNYVIEYRDLPPGSSKTTLQKEFHLPLSYFDDAKRYSPTGALQNYSGPKLIICATHDQFTKPSIAKEVYNSAEGPKSFLELDTEHDYRLDSVMIKKINTAIKDFIKTELLK